MTNSIKSPTLCAAVILLVCFQQSAFALRTGVASRPGHIYAWGDCGSSGDCVPPAGEDFIQIGGGKTLSMALRADGSIEVFGANRYGAITEKPTTHDFIKIACGMDHCVAMREDGTLIAWGGHESTPKEVVLAVPEGNDFLDLAAGGGMTCVIRNDGPEPGQGSIHVWGAGGSTMLTPPDGNNFVNVTCGNKHCCAMRADSTVVCWGNNTHGQCSLVPTTPGWIDICAAGYKTLGLHQDGHIYIWGAWDASAGYFPPNDPLNNYIFLNGGKYVLEALREDNSVVIRAYDVAKPGEPSSDRNDIVAVAAGYYHGLAIISEDPRPAKNPTPADGASGVDINVDIAWTAGEGAASHNVYFGTASPLASQGNQAATSFEPGTLANGTTYYWRIDEVQSDSSVVTGRVWMFTTVRAPIPPSEAYNPQPADTSTNVDPLSDLSWSAGANATSHDVYFGTPNPPPFIVNQTAATYDAGIMNQSMTYYWRIVEKNEYGSATGPVWSFTTGQFVNPTGATGWWRMDETSGTTASDSSGNGYNGTLVGPGLYWTGDSLNFDASVTGSNVSRVEIPTSPLSLEGGTVSLWAKLAEPQIRTGGRNNMAYFFGCDSGTSEIKLYMSNSNTKLDARVGSTIKNDVITLSTNTWYNIVLTWDEEEYTVYVNGNKIVSTSYSGLTALPAKASIGNNGDTNTQSVHGLIDEVRIWQRVLSAGEAVALYGVGRASAPSPALNPSPSNGDTGVDRVADLSWTAGTGAASHDVYFGTNSASPAFQGNQTAATFEPGTMNPLTTYYWRIDEKNSNGATTGSLWSFTTGSTNPPGQASNPSPANGATDVNTTADLSWTAGSEASSHDVYFGTNSASPAFAGNQTATTFDTGIMEYGTTYYWRIDEKNSNGTTTGQLWNFTTTQGQIVPGQTGSWRLNESSGTTAADSSGNGYNGTLIGAGLVWAPTGGIYAGALNFDATVTGSNTSRVEIPSTGISTTAGTVALWAKLAEPQIRTDGRNGSGYFFGCRQGSDVSKIQLYMNQNNTYLDAAVGNATINNTTLLSTNTWHHIALTWNAGNYVVYVDGSSVKTGTYGGLTTLPATANIGNNGSTNTQSYHGLLDSVKIYNRALSAAEINTIMQSQ